MAEIAWKTATELARLIAAKELSPVEVVQAYLERIAVLDGTLHAFLRVMETSALEAARRAEADVLSGRPLGRLHGVPIALKDLVNVKGQPTTGGSTILRDAVAPEDATVARRLQDAGAIVVGKLNLHEFAYGPEGLNDHYGHARNPWDAAEVRIAGGSSSGSGVAVSAALCAGALGTDTGGSVRIPSSLCGITGLKPTYGRVSRAGVIALAWSMDHVGPMARSARDCAAILADMAGYDPADPTTSVLPVPDYSAALTGDVKGLRIGLLRGFFRDGVDPEVLAAVEAAARLLERQGARVDEVELEHIEHVPGASFAIIASEALAYHAEWLRTRAADYQADVADRLRMGAFLTGAQYVRAQQVRTLVRRGVEAALAARDALLAPTTPIAATPIGVVETEIGTARAEVRASLIRFTRPFNMSGNPTCSLPCGFTGGGLPIGLQVIGRPFDEATVLRVADGYQRETDWHLRRPAIGG